MPGKDSAGRDGHARLGDADAFDEQAHAAHELVVVEERFAHAHEDEVDAVFAGLDGVAVEHGGDLAGDLAGGEVALDAELCGEAELAVHCAADLRGDADGRAAEAFLGERAEVGAGAAVAAAIPEALLPCTGDRFFGVHGFGGLFFCGFAAVAALAAVAVGHPDGLDGLTVGHAHEVALGAVDGAGGLDDLWQADAVAGGHEALAELVRERGDVLNRGDALLVEGFPELACTEGLLTEAGHQLGQLGQGLSEERRHTSSVFAAVAAAADALGGGEGGDAAVGFGYAVGDADGCIELAGLAPVGAGVIAFAGSGFR